MNFSQIFAIAKKEMKLNFRFKLNYFAEMLFYPLRFIALFFIVYRGFFATGAKNIGYLNRANYVSFLILGGLASTFFTTGFYIFYHKFIYEKYWQTINSFIIAPVHRLKLAIGIGISESIRLGLTLTLFLSIAYMITPITFTKLLLAVLIALLLFLGTMGIGLIMGAFVLSNENVIFLFEYLFWGWSFVSCFYYPLSSLPKFFRPLALSNPIYHGLELIRGLWFGVEGPSILHFSFLFIFSIFSPIVGAYLFNKIVKRTGITGY